jgi:hypothetical protein
MVAAHQQQLHEKARTLMQAEEGAGVFSFKEIVI